MPQIHFFLIFTSSLCRNWACCS